MQEHVGRGEPAPVRGHVQRRQGGGGVLPARASGHAEQEQGAARPGAVPVQRDAAPAHGHAVQGVPDVRLRVPDRGRGGGRDARDAHERVPRPRRAVRVGAAGHGGAPRAHPGVRAAQLPVHADEQAQAAVAGGPRGGGGLVRPAVPDHPGHHPPRRAGAGAARLHPVAGLLSPHGGDGVGQVLVHERQDPGRARPPLHGRVPGRKRGAARVGRAGGARGPARAAAPQGRVHGAQDGAHGARGAAGARRCRAHHRASGDHADALGQRGGDVCGARRGRVGDEAGGSVQPRRRLQEDCQGQLGGQGAGAGGGTPGRVRPPAEQEEAGGGRRLQGPPHLDPPPNPCRDRRFGRSWPAPAARGRHCAAGATWLLPV
mmetsp:Transcript_7504/g.23672  ORF Transcript_7504/g.23672 Transcript_7504/m.23672 type:complete len:373 (+) Transcript_7504:148-1266(+)